MSYQSFEDLDVWQRGCRLAVEIFQAFQDCKYHSLRNQIERCALSVPSNLAEGAERGGTKEFAQFLKIAKGSAGEMRTQLYIAAKLEVISKEQSRSFIKESRELSSMLEGLRKSILRPKTNTRPHASPT